MKILEGDIYTVDDVSDLLGIPRPTLYRYLREYSIPHLRQGGRIQIPEDSFDRIREARDLHKEGLGTESVRRQLREGGGPDTNELDRRLNKLHDTLEDLKDDLKAKPSTGEVVLSPALRTILARQSLMLSAMFNLTGMVEDLLLANGKSRRRPARAFENDLAAPIEIPADDRHQIPGTVVTEPVPMQRTEAATSLPAPRDAGPGFGSLGRRRRRAGLALLSALLLTLLIVLFLPATDETAATNQPATRDAEQQRTPDERPAGAGGSEDRDQNAGDSADGGSGSGNTGDSPSGDTVPSGPDPAGAEAASAEDGTRTADAPTDTDGGVPDVSGQPLKEAARVISEAGYTVAAIRSKAGSGDPGTVTGTEPAAGTDAPTDTAVVLTTGAGQAGEAPAGSASASASATVSASASAPASASPIP